MLDLKKILDKVIFLTEKNEFLKTFISFFFLDGGISKKLLK